MNFEEDEEDYSERSMLRTSHPLAEVPTPYYLRRFSYLHNGETHFFDECISGPRNLGISSLTTSTKRPRQPRTLGSGVPAPKRRECEADEDLNVNIEELPTTNTPPLPPPRFDSPLHSQEQGMLSDTQIISTSQTLHSHLPQWGHRRRITDNQATLLSPTASPRSPPSPQSPDFAENGETGSENDSPSLSVQGVAAPSSARAFAPMPSHAIGSTSPLPLPLVDQPMLSRQLQLQPLQLQHAIFNSHDPLRDQLALLGDVFEKLPSALHRYTLFNLFRACSRSTLSALYGELESALRFDILGHLPPELSSMIFSHLDIKSVVAAAEVSQTWYKLIDSDDVLWQTMLEREALHPTPKDVQAAELERWGYTGWPTMFKRAEASPVNAFGMPVNVHKAVYRRLALIHKNWMSPDIIPRRYEIQCPDREVITCLDFSEDIIIASTEGKKHLNVYDIRSGLLLHEFTCHEGGVWALKRVGKDCIVSGSTDHTVRVWSLSKNRCTHVFRGHHATVRCLDVVMPQPGITTRDYPVILTGSRDTTMRIWRLPAYEDEDYDSKVAFNDKDNPYFVAELRGHEDSVRAVCGHQNLAVSGSYDFRVRVWDLTTFRCKHVLEGHANKVYAATIDPERNRCISASMDYHIKIWDLETGSQLHTLVGHTGLVGLLGLCDNTLVSAAADKTLRTWNPEDGTLSHCLTGHDSAILCFDHDSRRIVSGSERHLKLWDSRKGTFARDLLTNIERIWQVRFDRRRCVAAVARGRSSFLEILDFDFEPPPKDQQPNEEIVIPLGGSGVVHPVDHNAS